MSPEKNESRIVFNCQVLAPFGHFVEYPLPVKLGKFWEKFDDILYAWLVFSVTAYITLIVGNWVIRGFKKDQVPKTETAPSGDENLVSKAKKIKENITDNY